MNKSDIILPRSAINDQRIDNWLFRSRIIKSRAKAQKIIFDGLVRINKVKISKSSIKIKIGDIVTLSNIDNIIIFQYKVLQISKLYKKIKIV